MTDLTRIAIAIVVVIVLLVTGTTYLIVNEEGTTDPIEEQDITPLQSEFGSRMSSLIARSNRTDPESLEESIRNAVPEWIARTPFQVSGYTVSLKDSDVRVKNEMMRIDLPLPSPGVEDRLSGIHVNSMDFGTSGTVPMIPSVRGEASLDLLLRPLGGGEDLEKSLEISTEVADPDKAWIAVADLIERDVNGWGSGLARDVEYILNVLTRIRTSDGVGSRNAQSQYNVLNEGDVELALNFALALRITQITGRPPERLVRSIDTYYSRQSSQSMMNPTGFRPWSTTEIDNFIRYERRAPSMGRRDLGNLLSYAVNVGHSDSADLFSSYLYLKNTGVISSTRPAPLLEGRDFKSPLREMSMTNQRQPTDRSDPYALEYHPSYTDEDTISVQPRNSVLDQVAENESSASLDFDLEEEYLISGRDYDLEGIDDVRAWYTTSNPERTPESLQNKTQPTRCGGVPFPKELEERYFRLQWDLGITGDFTLEGNLEGWSGNTQGDREQKRTVQFDLPVRVYTWFGERPKNDNIDFFDINEGERGANENRSYLVVTPEANATEVFEKNISDIIRGAQEVLTSLLRTLEDPLYEMLLDEDSLWRRYQTLSLYTLNDLGRWIDGTGNLTELRNYWKDYLMQGALIPALDPIHTMSLIYDLDFTTVSDRFDMTARAPQGSMLISAHGMIKGPITFTFKVVSSSGVVVDIDLEEGLYQISGGEGKGVDTVGSTVPSQPPQELIDLALESDWKMEGGTIPATGLVNIEPLFNTRNSGEETVNLSVSLVASGSDPEVTPDYPDVSILTISDDLGLLRSLRDLKKSLPSENSWFGISASRESVGDLIPVERTLWIRTGENFANWDTLLPVIGNLVHTSQSPVAGGFGDLKGLEIAFSERTPSWTVSMSGFDDFVTLSYWNLNGDPSRSGSQTYGGIYSFSRDDASYSGPGNDWVVKEPDPLKPLW
mgnify:CR=1 FL=1